MTIRLHSKETTRRPFRIYKVETLSDLLRFVRDRTYEGYATIYRGQRRNWPLQPKVARFPANDQDGRGPMWLERRMFDEFRRTAISFAPQLPTDEWEVLAIAQHHGLPTRLLDWSYNPLVAAWFCVNEPPQPKAGAAVFWMHVPDKDDFVSVEERERSSFELTRYVVFEPRHVTTRIRVQDGVFTAHPFDSKRNEVPAFDRRGPHRGCMVKVLIPQSSFEEMCYELDTVGTNAGTLFPDLDGLARKIQDSVLEW